MRRRMAALGAIAVALASGASAQAFWSANGSGSGAGPTGTLGAPTVSGSPGAGTATLSWSAVSPPGAGAVTYYVTRNGGNPAGNCPTSAAPSAVLTCTDSGLSAATYSYTVTAVWLSWTATSSPATQVTLVSGALDHFNVTAATMTAGQAGSVSITAKDSAGNTVVGYTGVQCVTFSGPASSPNGTQPVYPAQGSCASGQSAVTFTNGLASVSVTLYNASTTTNLTVTDAPSSKSGSSGNFTVGPAASAGYSLTDTSGNPLGSQIVGVAFSAKLTVKDAYANTTPAYSGAKCLTFSVSPSGTPPSYPAQGSCSSGQSAVTFASGTATVSVTLFDASAGTVLSATDSTISGSSASFAVVDLSPANTALPVISGTPLQGQTLATTTGTWTNSPTSYAYQWLSCDDTGSNCVDIVGATSSSYTLTLDDTDTIISVDVTATNAYGSNDAVSDPTDLIDGLPPVNTSLPVISGTTTQGQTLTTTNGTWTMRRLDFGYQWRRCDSAGANCADIAGATASSYTLVYADAGSTIRVVVTAYNAYGSDCATSEPDSGRHRPAAREHTLAGDLRHAPSRARCSPPRTAPGRTRRPRTPTSGAAATAPARTARTSPARPRAPTRSSAPTSAPRSASSSRPPTRTARRPATSAQTAARQRPGAREHLSADDLRHDDSGPDAHSLDRHLDELADLIRLPVASAATASERTARTSPAPPRAPTRSSTPTPTTRSGLSSPRPTHMALHRRPPLKPRSSAVSIRSQ